MKERERVVKMMSSSCCKAGREALEKEVAFIFTEFFIK